MRKLLVLLSFLVIVVSVLAGCADDNGTSAPSTTTSPPSATTSPEPTIIPIAQPELSFTEGQWWLFKFFVDEQEFGTYQYKVRNVQSLEGNTLYTLESDLDLKSSSACKPTLFETTYTLTSQGTPVKYSSSGRIGSG